MLAIHARRALEYLVKRYHDGDRRPRSFRRLLTCVLPRHDAAPACDAFAWALRRIDLTAIPEWTFLRPYVAATTAPSQPLRVDRPTISRAAASDGAVLGSYLGTSCGNFVFTAFRNVVNATAYVMLSPIKLGKY